MKTFPVAALVSLACASPGAIAQTQINGTPLKDLLHIYGDLDVAVGRFKQAGGPVANRVESGLLSPSYLGFGGGLEIRQGLRGIFALETYIGLDKGLPFNFFSPTDPFWGRASYLGVESDYGTVTLGRNKNPFYYAATENNAFGESYFSPALTVAAFRRGHVIGRAHDNSVRYTSPTVSGFSAAALWAPKEDKTNGDDMSATVKYVRGPWLATLGAAQAKSGLTEGTRSSILLAATNYDFGIAKAFVELASQRDTEVLVKSKAWDLGVTAPLGSFLLRAAIAKIRQTDLEGASAATYRVASVGVDDAIAPGWTSYAGLKSEKVTGIVSATGYSFAAGLRWQF